MAFREQLCGCLTDIYSCLIAFYAPCGTCILQGITTNQATNEGFLKSFIISLFCCFGMSFNRQQIKRKYQIPETYWTDCLMYVCCAACGTSQEAREVENRYLENP